MKQPILHATLALQRVWVVACNEEPGCKHIQPTKWMVFLVVSEVNSTLSKIIVRYEAW